MNLQMFSGSFNYLDGVSEQVRRICHPVFSKTPINYFEYQTMRHDGEMTMLSTAPVYLVDQIAGKFLLPSFFEMELFRSFGQRVTFLSHVLALPPGADEINVDKFSTNIEYFSEASLYHRLYFVDHYQEYYRVVGFAVSNDAPSAINYYMNNLNGLSCFIDYFEEHALDLIANVNHYNRVTLPEYLHKPDMSMLAPELQAFAPIGFTEQVDPESYRHSDAFTSRESQCVALLARGYTVKMIGNHLGISPRTAEQHIRNAKDKLGFNTKKQLLEYWYER